MFLNEKMSSPSCSQAVCGVSIDCNVLFLLSSCKLCTDVALVVGGSDVFTDAWPVDCLSSSETHLVDCIVPHVENFQSQCSF